MSTRIYEALNGKQGNYILPFFWQHGEDEETLREYMGSSRIWVSGQSAWNPVPIPILQGPNGGRIWMSSSRKQGRGI